MSLELKTILSLATRRYIAPTIVVVLLLAGGMVYVLGEYKQVLKDKEQVLVERKTLYEERVTLEHTRSEVAIAQSARQGELEKREFILQQLESQNKERLADVQKKVDAYSAAETRLRTVAASVSRAQRTKEIEEKLQRLMSEFSSMGVDLNSPPKCGDTAGESRFNMAKSKYSEIYALAEAAGLEAKYEHFFFKNGQNMITLCPK